MEKELNASRQNSLSTYVFKKLREGIISGKFRAFFESGCVDRLKLSEQ